MKLCLIHPSDCRDDDQYMQDSCEDNSSVVRINFYEKAFPLSCERKDFNIQTLNLVWQYLGEVKHVYYEHALKYCVIHFRSAVDASFAVECFSKERSLLALFDAILGPNYDTDYAVLVAGVLEEYLVGPKFEPRAFFCPMSDFTKM